jgi:hypothetical protein
MFFEKQGLKIDKAKRFSSLLLLQIPPSRVEIALHNSLSSRAEIFGCQKQSARGSKKM